MYCHAHTNSSVSHFGTSPRAAAAGRRPSLTGMTQPSHDSDDDESEQSLSMDDKDIALLAKERDIILQYLSHHKDTVNYHTCLRTVTDHANHIPYAVFVACVIVQLMVKPSWTADKCTPTELAELDGVIMQIGGSAQVLPLLQHLSSSSRSFASLTDLLPAIRAGTFYSNDIIKEHVEPSEAI